MIERYYLQEELKYDGGLDNRINPLEIAVSAGLGILSGMIVIPVIEIYGSFRKLVRRNLK